MTIVIMMMTVLMMILHMTILMMKTLMMIMIDDEDFVEFDCPNCHETIFIDEILSMKKVKPSAQIANRS